MLKANRKFMLLCLVAVLSMAIYGCSGSSPTPTPPAGPTDAELIKSARDAAAAAAGNAMTASVAAAGAVAAVTASQSADLINYGKASLEAGNAADANADAQAANTAAQAAGVTVATAQKAQADAEADAAAANAASARAMTYAGMVTAAQTVIDNTAAEALALSNAKGAAMTAATAARKAADDAQTEANTVAELLGGTSIQAISAQAVATAAATAATAAEAASTIAQAATNSGAAMTAQATAEGKQGKAEGQLVIAKELKREAQVSADAAKKVEEEGKIADAQEAAGDAAMTARVSAVSARDNAGLARIAATAARTQADRAEKARTNSVDAGMAATAADAAATAAEAAATAAEAAETAAEAAETAALAATTSKVAEAEQTKAEAADGMASEEATTASTQLGTAKTQSGKAEDAANEHVLRLFMQANAYDITKPTLDNSGTDDKDESKTVAKQREEEVANIGAAMVVAAKKSGGQQVGAATVSAEWRADKVGNPGLLTITVKDLKSDNEVTSDTVGTPATGEVAAVAPNADQSLEDGDFQHMFDISNGEEVRVIAFTNREQSVMAVDRVTRVSFQNVKVTASEHIKSLGMSTDGGKTFPGTYDNNKNKEVEGTFTCGSDCTLVSQGTGKDFTVTKADNVTFTGTRAAKAGIKPDNNQDYLLFGLWLDESEDGENGDFFGAFGTGGESFNKAVKALMGTATYTGEAVGAHHKTGSSVSWFDGDASLTAKFGTAAEEGTIEGSISNISVNGGAAMSDSIYLVEPATGTLGKTFNGVAIMGVESTPGKDDHAYTGTWSGGFFNNPAEPDSALTGAAAAAAAHPRSVAGTFGVTRDTTGTGDDAVKTTESFVGAFAAHKD